MVVYDGLLLELLDKFEIKKGDKSNKEKSELYEAMTAVFNSRIGDGHFTSTQVKKRLRNMKEKPLRKKYKQEKSIEKQENQTLVPSSSVSSQVPENLPKYIVQEQGQNIVEDLPFDIAVPILDPANFEIVTLDPSQFQSL